MTNHHPNICTTGTLAASLQQADCYAHWLSPTRGAWMLHLIRLLTGAAAWLAGHLESMERRSRG